MRQNIILTALLFGLSNISKAQATCDDPPPTETLPACAQVSSAWAAQIETNTVPTVAASLAYDCLNSVPLNQEAAIQLVDAIEPYLDYQSDIAYKADPPPDYPFPAYDVLASLADVRARLVNGSYKNEIDFQLDLYLSVFARGHDGHFGFLPDALTSVMAYVRPISLVSISEDGVSLPVIKVYEDVLANPQTASAVKTINGVPADKFVLDAIAGVTLNQDLDAAYNTMFFGPALAASLPGFRGFFRTGGGTELIYPGPTTDLTFVNGTNVKLSNFAFVTANMTGVVDGASFYEAFCLPKPLPPPSGEVTAPPDEGIVVIPGYPKPVIATQDGSVSGYFLDGEGLEDVAVIALLSFVPHSPLEFQAVCQVFFSLAQAAGKTKLVIDLQGNPGGELLLSYAFFAELFPHVVPDGFSRWKGSDSFLQIAKVYSDEAAHVDPFTSDDTDAINDYLTWYNFRFDLNLTNQNFPSFDAKFSPHIFQNTSYTSIMRWNLSDPLIFANDTFGIGIEINGSGSLSNASQPFEAENIVMIYDGFCASTCALVSEMLRIQGNVPSVAFGGRPQTGPIQGVGGVKGAQSLAFGNVHDLAQHAINITTDESIKKSLSRFNTLPMQRSTHTSLNARDQILHDNVQDGLPAQYVVEYADCRLYWTADMVTNVSNIWTAAANSAFNLQECAYGGIRRNRTTSLFVQSSLDATELNAKIVAGSQRLSEIRSRGAAPRSRLRQLTHNKNILH